MVRKGFGVLEYRLEVRRGARAAPGRRAAAGAPRKGEADPPRPPSAGARGRCGGGGRKARDPLPFAAAAGQRGGDGAALSDDRRHGPPSHGTV